ncbi:hypothetical protein ABH904_003763 [Pseudomonas frederiksbergensis]
MPSIASMAQIHVGAGLPAMNDNSVLLAVKGQPLL